MGRAVCVAAISLLLILGISFFCDRASDEISRDLLRHTDQVERLARQGKRQEALEYISRLQKEWEGREEFLSYFSHHQLMDSITEALMQVEAALKEGDAYAFSYGMAGLERAARALHEEEAFLLKNLW